jgi:hypothetical protein
LPGVKQIYFSGCGGNVTAGKYNNGDRANRAVLADRLHEAMVAAWRETKRHPLSAVRFRSTTVRLEPRAGPGFTVADLEQKLATETKPFQQCLAALALRHSLARSRHGATARVAGRSLRGVSARRAA